MEKASFRVDRALDNELSARTCRPSDDGTRAGVRVVSGLNCMKIIAGFPGGKLTSDADALLPRVANHWTGPIGALAACIENIPLRSIHEFHTAETAAPRKFFMGDSTKEKPESRSYLVFYDINGYRYTVRVC